MTEPQTTPSRRDFLKTTRHWSRRPRPSQTAVPLGPRRREQHDPGRPGRLRRPRHRRGGQRPVDQERPDQARRHGRRLRGPAQRQLRRPQEGARRQAGRRPRRPQVHRLRRLQEGDGLPQARRRRHPRHAAGLPLGPLHLRHREGPQRLHGEAGHRRRADHAARCSSWARRREEEPQGRRRPDVPPLRGPRGAVQADQGRRDRRHHRCCGPTARPARSARRSSPPKPDDISELLYQIQQVPRLPLGQRRLLQRLPDPQHRRMLLDEGRLAGQGRRPPAAAHYRGDYIDQNFDTYSVEYTFADGTKLFLEGRNIDGCHQEFASYAHGTKGSAVISTDAPHARPSAGSTRARRSTKNDLAWAFPQPEPNPYQLEWDHLIDAIRKDKPYNEVKRGAEASLVTSMGRMAAHTGQVITFDDMLNCEHEFAPDVDKLDHGRPRAAPGRAPTASTPCPSRASSATASSEPAARSVAGYGCRPGEPRPRGSPGFSIARESPRSELLRSPSLGLGLGPRPVVGPLITPRSYVAVVSQVARHRGNFTLHARGTGPHAEIGIAAERGERRHAPVGETRSPEVEARGRVAGKPGSLEAAVSRPRSE